jgi:hypothetical protein
LEPQRVRLDRLRLDVPDLDAADAALERLGFATVPLGASGWRGVALPFEHLELEAAAAPGLAAIGLVREPERAAANDAAPATREVVGTARLAFAEEALDAAGLPLVLSRTLTPETLRPPAALRHPNGALGLVGATCVVADPERAARALGALLGEAAITRTDAIFALRLARTTLLVASASDAELLHPDLTCALDDPVPAPRVVAVAIEVADTERTAEAMQARGQAVQRRPDGSLGAAAPALGLAFEFRRRP